MKEFHQAIQSSGGRLTKIKKAIVDILSAHHCLLTKADLLDQLKEKDIRPDRSTIYRELQFLTKNNLILHSTILGVDYYEMPSDHHHHLICLQCNGIDKIEMGNHLQQQEKLIAKENNFTIINHSLEFYGYCHKCQK